MIKADIVMKVSDVSNVPRMKAVQAVDTIIDAMKDALCDGRRIELRGFGVFQVRDRKKGVGRNPKTGVEVAITPGRTVRFKTRERPQEPLSPPGLAGFESATEHQPPPSRPGRMVDHVSAFSADAVAAAEARLALALRRTLHALLVHL